MFLSYSLRLQSQLYLVPFLSLGQYVSIFCDIMSSRLLMIVLWWFGFVSAKIISGDAYENSIALVSALRQNIVDCFAKPE